jgi:murein peptide amidase A
MTRTVLSAFAALALWSGLPTTAATRTPPSLRLQLGRSEEGRRIVAIHVGDPHATRVLVVGCIHGTECAGIAVARALERARTRADLWIVPNLNPDGYARGTRQNGRGVDLNANWSSQWHAGGHPWDVYYPGPRPFSERETRIARNLILRIRPRVTIWFHQHLNLVWAWGPSTSAGRIYARAAGMRFYHRHWLHGTATNWQNHHLPGSASFTVELPAASLTPQQVRRQVHAVLTLAAALRGADRSSTRPRHARAASWMLEADRLIGRLPISVSVRERGRLVYAHAGNLPRTPASNEKLLLSMALLAHFGPAYRIPTMIDGRRPANGIVDGDLWLVGHGDPEVNDAALQRLARALSARGIRAVHGSLIGVTDTFTRERWAPGWRPIALQFIALPTALTFDANTGPRGFVFDPERRAAAVLTADLRALGVRVRKPAEAGARPAHTRVLATIRSAPLASILRRQNAGSLNLDAEVLTKMLGAAIFGPPGTIAKGARAIRRWARQRRVTIVARDGSGLSYANKISTNGLTRLLAATRSEPWARTLRSTLPTSGEGTLAGRLRGLRIRAKTGTLIERVSALSGWAWLQRSRRWGEFSILSRGLQKPQALALEDRLVSLIATHA